MPANRPDVEFKTSSMNSMIGLLTIIARAIWIRWSSSSDRIKPGVPFALKWFSKWTHVLPMASSEDDFLWTTLEKASSEEQDAKLRSLYSQDPIGAVQTMQLLRRCSQADAEKYLNQLTAQPSATQ
jgi:hypothetical protein